LVGTLSVQYSIFKLVAEPIVPQVIKDTSTFCLCFVVRRLCCLLRLFLALAVRGKVTLKRKKTRFSKK
jgi:hypothetical protein